MHPNCGRFGAWYIHLGEDGNAYSQLRRTIPRYFLQVCSFGAVLTVHSICSHGECNRYPIRRPLSCAKYVETGLQVYACSRSNTLFAVGWGTTQSEPGFGATQDNASIKAKMINLISSVRTLMRGTKHAWLSLTSAEQMTVPLIFVNLLIIVWAITFG